MTLEDANYRPIVGPRRLARYHAWIHGTVSYMDPSIELSWIHNFYYFIIFILWYYSTMVIWYRYSTMVRGSCTLWYLLYHDIMYLPKLAWYMYHGKF